MNKEVYRWKEGCRIKVDPKEAYQTITALRKKLGSAWGPAALKEEARDPASIFHNEFEWDDGKAAEEHRLSQARKILRSLVVTIVREDPEEKGKEKAITLKVFEAVDGKYQPTKKILSNSEERRRFLLRIWGRIISLKNQYKDYHEFSEIWEAVDAVEVNLADRV